MGGACSTRGKKCIKIGKPARINHMDDQGGDAEEYIKKDIRHLGGRELDYSGTRQRLLAGACKHCKKPSSSLCCRD